MKNEKVIRGNVMAGAPSTAKAARHVRDKALIKIESVLFLWLEDHIKKSSRIDSNIIREKKKLLYDHFMMAGGGENKTTKRKIQKMRKKTTVILHEEEKNKTSKLY